MVRELCSKFIQGIQYFSDADRIVGLDKYISGAVAIKIQPAQRGNFETFHV